MRWGGRRAADRPEFLRRQLDYDVVEFSDLKPPGWPGNGNTSLGQAQTVEDIGCHDTDNLCVALTWRPLTLQPVESRRGCHRCLGLCVLLP